MGSPLYVAKNFGSFFFFFRTSQSRVLHFFGRHLPHLFFFCFSFVYFFGWLPKPCLFLWAAAKANLILARLRPALTFLPLGDLTENQSISTPSFLLRHNHIAYVSARPQEDLLQTNLSVFIGLVKTSARFSFVWIFCKSTFPSSTIS